MTRRTEVSCYDAALGFLARRPHFASEMTRKLGRRYESGPIEETLGRLSTEGLINDLACARAYCDGPLRRKGYGPNRVRQDLMRRGAAPEIAQQATDEAFPEGDREFASAAAERWLSRSRDSEPDRRALARFLERQGFTRGRSVRSSMQTRSEAIPRRIGRLSGMLNFRDDPHGRPA